MRHRIQGIAKVLRMRTQAAFSAFVSDSDHVGNRLLAPWKGGDDDEIDEQTRNPREMNIVSGDSTPRKPPHWYRSYGSYSNAELRALTFRSRKEINRAVDAIWTDPELRGMPNDSPDGMTLFVPAEAVELLKTKSLSFSVSELLSSSDVPPDRYARMRDKYGM